MLRTQGGLTSWDRRAVYDTIGPEAMVRYLLVFTLVAGCRSPAAQPEIVDAWLPVDAPPTLGAGNGGGTLDELRFAIIGDTRPANLDDTAHYPRDIVDHRRNSTASITRHTPPRRTRSRSGRRQWDSVDVVGEQSNLDALLAEVAAALVQRHRRS